MSKFSDTEKQAWRAKMRGFVDQVSQLSPEQRQALSQRMPITTCEGHPLSVFNQCFLAMQSPLSLTIVAGFQQWKKSGRMVSEGQHAPGYIYVPIGKIKKDEDLDKESERVHFRLVPVFDISQTEVFAADKTQAA